MGCQLVSEKPYTYNTTLKDTAQYSYDENISNVMKPASVIWGFVPEGNVTRCFWSLTLSIGGFTITIHHHLCQADSKEPTVIFFMYICLFFFTCMVLCVDPHVFFQIICRVVDMGYTHAFKFIRSCSTAWPTHLYWEQCQEFSDQNKNALNVSVKHLIDSLIAMRIRWSTSTVTLSGSIFQVFDHYRYPNS